MKEANDRIVGAIFFAALTCLVLFLFNRWALFGVVSCGLLVLSLALGHAPRAGRRPIRGVLILLFGAYALVLAAMAWIDRAQTFWLLLGFPAATALLIYGIWPLPLLAGLLYGLVFRSSVLPRERLEKFLAAHGKRGRAR